MVYFINGKAWYRYFARAIFLGSLMETGGMANGREEPTGCRNGKLIFYMAALPER